MARNSESMLPAVKRRAFNWMIRPVSKAFLALMLVVLAWNVPFVVLSALKIGDISLVSSVANSSALVVVVLLFGSRFVHMSAVLMIFALWLTFVTLGPLVGSIALLIFFSVSELSGKRSSVRGAKSRNPELYAHLD